MLGSDVSVVLWQDFQEQALEPTPIPETSYEALGAGGHRSAWGTWFETKGPLSVMNSTYEVGVLFLYTMRPAGERADLVTAMHGMAMCGLLSYTRQDVMIAQSLVHWPIGCRARPLLVRC